MKKSFLISILIFSNFIITAQDDWGSYIIQKEKGIMAISVNMRYEYARPNYKHLLVVGTHTTKCLKNGYPTEEGLEKMYTFSDSIANIVDGLTKNRLVGIMTYQCSGFDIFYVKDTTNLRKRIVGQINKNFNSSKTYLQIEGDKKWKYYHTSLYPKDDSEEFFINHELLTEFVYQGDDLIQPRKVSHWFYFNKEKKRQKFIDKISGLNFSIDSLNYRKKRDYYRYELQVSRKDSIHPKSISKLTKTLIGFANLLYAEYDGWSAELAKEN
jgi:hypothetical protein